MSPAADKRRRDYDRRHKATVEGRHLPTVDELVRGFPFMNEKLGLDAQAYVERLLPRLNDKNDPHGHARRALTLLTLAPDVHEYLDAADALKALEGGPISLSMAELLAVARMRCIYYAAALGDRGASQQVAAEAVDQLLDFNVIKEDVESLSIAAFGWLASSRRAPRFRGTPTEAWNLGKVLVRLLVDSKATEAAKPPKNNATEEPEQPVEETQVVAPTPEHGLIVVRAIGNSETNEGKKVAREFGPILGEVLPLVETPNLMDVRKALMTEFPHASAVIDLLLFDFATNRFIRCRPTVLVGEPGSGKTTFSSRLLEALGVQNMVYSCGGVNDSSFAGTARHWSTGEPSVPMALCKRWMTASPGIILDEIEKVATSKHNGSVLDALLGLLEPQSSTNWRDPYLESEVDLSRVIWFATANSVHGLPSPVRDRCRIIAYPTPGPEHLEVLAAAVLPKIATSQGLDPRWVRPLDPEELGVLKLHWPGGSVRRLTRLVEALVKVRGHDQRQQ